MLIVTRRGMADKAEKSERNQAPLHGGQGKRHNTLSRQDRATGSPLWIVFMDITKIIDAAAYAVYTALALLAIWGVYNAILLYRSLAKKSLDDAAGLLKQIGTLVHSGKHDAAIASVEKATAAMKAGQSFLIYPEGTRSPDGRLQDFKKGAVVMAIKAGVPIVPMACSGAHRVMEKHSLVIHPGEIVVEFLEPIDASQFTFEQRHVLNERVHDALAAGLPPDQRPLGFPGATEPQV